MGYPVSKSGFSSDGFVQYLTSLGVEIDAYRCSEMFLRAFLQRDSLTQFVDEDFDFKEFSAIGFRKHWEHFNLKNGYEWGLHPLEPTGPSENSIFEELLAETEKIESMFSERTRFKETFSSRESIMSSLERIKRETCKMIECNANGYFWRTKIEIYLVLSKVIMERIFQISETNIFLREKSRFYFPGHQLRSLDTQSRVRGRHYRLEDEFNAFLDSHEANKLINMFRE